VSCCINVNSSILGIDNPVLQYAVFGIKLALDEEIAITILFAGRHDFDNEIRSSSESVIANNLIPSFIADENQIGNNCVVVAENSARSGNCDPDRMILEIGAKGHLKIVKNALMGDSRGAGHEQFSFDKFVAITVIRTCIEVCDGE
jgi:hypothetical protein